MRLYFVTGASGFIGRALCAHLAARNHRVRAMLRHESTGPWHEAAICDLTRTALPESMLDGIDSIFHCAGAAHFRGLSKQAQEELWQLNVNATESLLNLAQAKGVKRLVYFSSVQAAGKPGETVATEDWRTPPDNIYGESKLAAENLLLAAAADNGMHTAILRPALVYGPGVKGNLARMLSAVARGRMPPLPDSGKQRSMVALDNLVDAATLAMENDAAHGRTYIVCDEQPYSTRAIYQSMMHCVQRPIPAVSLPLALFKLAAKMGDFGNLLTDNAMPWDSSAYERLFGPAVYSAGRIRQELGWRPSVDFAQVLPDMVAAMQRVSP